MLIYAGLASNGIPVFGVFSIFGLDKHGVLSLVATSLVSVSEWWLQCYRGYGSTTKDA